MLIRALHCLRCLRKTDRGSASPAIAHLVCASVILLLFVAPSSVFAQGILTDVAVTPTDTTAGAGTIYTVSFITSSTGGPGGIGMPADGKIRLTFPAGFITSSILLPFNVSGLTGGYLTPTIAGQVVTLTRDNTGNTITLPPDTVVFKLAVVGNPALAGNYTLFVETLTNLDAAIDSARSDTFRVGVGPLHHVKVLRGASGDSAEVGAVALTADDTLTVHAGAFDAYENYRGDVAVNWSVSGGIGTLSSAAGISTILNASKTGTGQITADHATALDDATGNITVTPGVLAKIFVVEGNSGDGPQLDARSLTADQSLTVHAGGYDADNNYINDQSVDWTVTNGIGTLSTAAGTATTLEAKVPGVGVINADHANPAIADDATGLITVSIGAPHHVKVLSGASGATAEITTSALNAGGTLQVHASSFDADDNRIGDVSVNWSVSGNIGSLSAATGTTTILTAENAGTGIITADHATFIDDATGNITVNAGPLAKVLIVEGATGNGLEMGAKNVTTDQSLEVHAAGYDAFDNYVGDQVVGWSVSNGIGTVSPISGTSTILSLTQPGSGNIFADHPSISVNDDFSGTITVNAGAAVRVKVLTGASGNTGEVGPQIFSPSNTLTVHASSFDGDGNYIGDVPVTWNVSGGIGTLSPASGVSTTFTATTVGSGIITADDPALIDGFSGTITVAAGALSFIKVVEGTSGNGPELTTRSLTTDQSLPVHAAGYDAGGNYIGDFSVNWSIVAGSIGTLSTAVGTTTTLDARTPGVAQIRADHSNPAVTDDNTGNITVNLGNPHHVKVLSGASGATAEVTSPPPLAAGTLFTVHASSFDADDNRIGDVTVNWTVSGGIGILIPSTGTSTTLNTTTVGSGVITADHATLIDDATGTITVTAGSLNYVKVVEGAGGNGPELANKSLTTDNSLIVHAAGYDVNGNYITDVIVNWSVSGGIGTISPASGVSATLTLTTPGSGIITADHSSANDDGSGTISVTVGAPHHIKVLSGGNGSTPEEGASSLQVGSNLTVHAGSFDADDNYIGDVSVTWSVSGGIGNLSSSLNTTTTLTAQTVGSGTIFGDHPTFIDDATGTITVTPGALAKVRIVEGASGNGPELGDRILTTDQSLIVHAAGYDASDNYLGDVSVTWSVSGGIGTLSPNSGTSTTLTLTTAGSGIITADHASVTDDVTGTITVNAGVAHNVKVLAGASGNTSPVGAQSLTTGATLLVHAGSFDADNNYTGDVSVAWSLSSNIGTLNPASGISTTFTANAVGTGVITADHATLIDGASGLITVSAGSLGFIKIVEGTSGNGPELGDFNMTADGTLTVHAAGYDASGNYIGDQTVTWGVSNGIGTLSMTLGTSTILDATTPGTGIITADASGSITDDVSGNITVTAGAPKLVKVLDGPSGNTAEVGNRTLTAGQTLEVHAGSFDADGNYLGDVSVSWQLSAAIGTLNPASGTSTTFTASTAGSGIITADHATFIDDATGTITVVTGTLSYIKIVEGPAGNGTELSAKNLTTDQTLTVHAAGYDASNNYIGDQSVTWTVTNGIGTLSTLTGASTLFDPKVPGSGVLIADHATAIDDTTGTITVSVGAEHRVKILADASGATAEVGAVNLNTGQTLPVHAASFDADGNYVADVGVDWSLSAAIGTLNPVTGISTTFTATTVGTGFIAADHSSFIDDVTGTITVAAGNLSYIKIVEGPAGNTPEVGDISLTTDQTRTMHAAGFDANNNYLGDQSVTWSVSGGIGTLSTATGTSTTFDARSPGSGFVTADHPTATDDNTGTITVNVGVPHHVKILAGATGAGAEVTNQTLQTGNQFTMHASSFDADDNRIGDVSVSWSVSGGIGTLAPTSGISTTFTATTVGSGVITADHATLIDDATGTFVVNSGGLSFIKIVEGTSGNGPELGNKSLSTDQTLTVHAAGYDASGNYLGDQAVTWTVSGGIGTLSPASGTSTVLDARTPGSGTITADHATATDDNSGTITVTLGAQHHVKILAGANGAGAEVTTQTLQTGNQFVMHASSFDADDNRLGDVSVNWSVSGGIGTLAPLAGISTTFTATTVGSGIITADHPSLIDDATGTFVVNSGTLSYIKIVGGPSGNTPEVGDESLTADGTLTVHAAGFDANNNYLGDQAVTWNVSGGIGTLSTTSGIATTLDAKVPGTGIISADHTTATDDVTGTITVTPGVPHHLKVLGDAAGNTPEVGNVPLTTGQTLLVHAGSFDADDNYLADVSAAWSLSSPIGTLAPASGISTTLTATTVGSATLLADHATLIDDATGVISVTAGNLSFVKIVEGTSGNGMEVGDKNLTTDETLVVHAAGYDVSGNYVGDQPVTWSVSGGIGAVNPTAGPSTTLTLTRPGSGRITADHAAATDDETSDLTVAVGALHHVKVLTGNTGNTAPVGATALNADQTLIVHAGGFDADDNYINDVAVNWSVSGGIGTISPATAISTTLTARKIGFGVITADHATALDGQSGTITVTAGALAFIKVIEGPSGNGAELGAKTITADDVLQLHAAGFDADSNYIGDQPANWSSAGSLAPVVTGTNVPSLSFAPTLAPASGTIRATHSTAGFDDTGIITVNDGALRKIKILAGPNGETTEVGATTLASGQTLEVHAGGFDADDNYITDLSANWSVDGGIGAVAPASGVATIFTAGATGTGLIRATAAGNLEDVTGTITVIPGGVTRIVLRTEPGNGGTPINNFALTADQDLTLYAAAYDAGDTYIGDVSVTWTTTNNLTPAISATGSSVIFSPALANADGSVNGLIIGEYSPTIKDSTGLITVLPGNPSGTISLTPAPSGLPSDGASTSTITSGTIKDADGNNVGAGKRFTVTLTPNNLGVITTPDVDPATPDVQIETDAASQLSFVFQAGTTGGIVAVNVSSGLGATGSTQISLGSISIVSVTTTPTTVSRGQTGISVSMTVQNVSSAPLTEVTAGLTFTGTADRTGEYSVVPNPGNPTSLPGNSTATFSFIVNVGANATLETVILNGTVSGKVNGTPVSSNNAGQTDSWAVQLPAVLSVTSVTATPDTVAQGQTGIEVRVRVANNLGQPNSASATVDSVRLIFKQGPLIKTSEYIIGLPTGPASIAGNAEEEFLFLVNVGSAATLGLIAIDASAYGKEGNTSLPLTDLNAGTPDSWTVIEGNVFSIVAMAASQNTVTANMTKPWQVRMELNNGGSSPIQLDLAPAKTFIQLTIGNQNVTSQFGITPPAALDEGGTVLLADSTGHLTFTITPTCSTTGTARISGFAEGRDQAGQTVMDNTNDFGEGAVTVQSPGTMRIDRLDVSQSPVTANRGKDWVVTATITNEGESAVQLHPAADSMKITIGNNAGYVYIKPSTFTDGTSILGSRATKLLEIVVDQTGSQTGTLPINVSLKGIETNSDRLVASTGVSGSIIVQSQAVLEITSVTPSQPTVTTGQTAAWNVTVAVRNNGGSQVAVKSDSSTNLRFRIGTQFQNDYTVALLSAPTIGAGATANLIFQINATGANAGTAALWVKVAATETNSDAEVIDTDNGGSVIVQSPPNVTYIANSMSPDIVNLGTFYAFRVRVRNIAGASTVNLNSTNTRFLFSGGPANFVAALDANFVQSITPGDTTLTFVATAIPANMPVGTYTPLVELRGTENGNPFSRDLSVTLNELQVTQPADVQVVSVQPSQSTVTAGMTKPWNVVVRVANNGGFQAKFDSVGLQLVNGIDRKSEYNITYPTQFLGSGSTFLDAGMTDSLRFVFNSTGTTTGSTALQVTLFMKDQSSGLPIIPRPAGNASFIVQSPAVIKVTNIATSQPAVTANRTKDWTITATVTNEGESAIRLHPALDSLKVTIGNNAGYVYVKPATFADGSNLLGGGQTKNLAIIVDQTGPQTGTLPINVSMKGIETNSDRLIASTGVSGSIIVQSQADLQIVSVTPSRPTVTTSQAAAWNVTVAVRNIGGSQVAVKSDSSTNLRFRIGTQFQNDYTVALLSAPTIGAGATANLIFQINATGANAGTAALWVKVAATETNSDADVIAIDNGGNVIVQSPPNVTYIANSMLPDIVNLGTFYAFRVRVRNIAGASTVALNSTNTRFLFSGGPANFVAALDANFVQNIAPGDTTLTFVVTAIPANMPIGTYTPLVELRGTENGNPFSRDLSVTLNELQVTQPADVQVVAVQPSQSTVTAGMTKPWNVVVRVANNGGFQAKFDSVGLQLVNGIDRKSEYSIVYPTQFLGNGSMFLGAGETDSLRFVFNSTGTTTGSTALQVTLFMQDQSSGLPIIPRPAGNASFIVQSPAVVKVTNIATSQPTVTANRTKDWTITATVTNEGESAIRLHPALDSLKVTVGNNAGYVYVKPATFADGSNLLGGGQTKSLAITVDQTGSQTGTLPIRVDLKGIETNSDRLVASTGVSGSINVQSEADLQIVSVTPSRPTVTINQTTVWTVTAAVRNNGGSQVVVKNDTALTSLRFRIGTQFQGGYVVALQNAPAINAGATTNVIFRVTTTGPNPGTAALWVKVEVTETNSDTTLAVTDNSSSVVVQSPPNLTYIANSMLPDVANIGTFYAFTVRVRNVAGASTVALDPANTRLRFSGGPTTYTASLDPDPGKVQSIPPGDTTLTFVSVAIPANMPEGTYTPVVELRGTENGNPFNRDISVTLDELQVTRPADVQIVSVTASQSTMTAGMTKPWNATLLVTNNGGFQFQLDSLNLRLINSIDRKAEYDIVYPAQFLRTGTPLLAAGETDTLRLIFNRTGSTTGPTALSVFVHGKDPSSGQLVTSQEGSTSFLVQSPAVLRINGVTPSQPTVTRNQTQQWQVDMSVTNLGQSEMAIDFNSNVTGIILGFNTGYNIQPPTAFLSGSTRLLGGATDTLRFTITQTGSQTGLNTIAGRIAGTELNSGDPRSDDTNDSGASSVLVQTEARLRLDTVRVVGAPNAPFVNLSQAFGVRLVVRNLGEETADEVRVQVTTNGGSQIIPAAGDTAGNIAGGTTKAVTFSITAANTENLLGERFRGLITGAVAHNTGTNITPQTALDDTAVVIIQRSANLVIDEVVASRDTVSAGQTDDWFIYAVVRNTGAATMTLNTPDRNQLRIEIAGAQQTDYGVEVDPALLQNGSLTLTGGESDTLRFTVTSTGLSSGTASLIVSLAAIDRNDIKPVSAQNTGQIYVRTTATVRLVQTDPVVLRPLLNGTAFVNVDQVFSVKLTVENTGFEDVKDVVVRLQTDGPSRILTPEQTITAIASRARQEISFSVEADTGAIAGAPPEIFTARVVSALTEQGNQPANVLTPLDSTTQIVVQRPARLSVAASIQDNNPILSTNQPFTFSALVTNSGQAPVDGSGLVRLITPPGFNVTGSNELSFIAGQLVTWQVRAPLAPANAADLRVQITKAAVDSNSQTLATLGKDSDTLTVQVVSSDLRIVKLEITAQPGARDRTLSTEQLFDFTARLAYTPDLRNGTVNLRVPPEYNITQGPQPAFGETVTWKVRATATANSIPVYLAVTATGQDGSGDPVAPAADSISVTTIKKASLSLLTEISDPPGAIDGVVSFGQEFTITARVLNDGDAGVESPARLRIEYDTAQGFSTVEELEKDVNVGSSVQWKFTAPNQAASDIFTIRYAPLVGVPADTNTNEPAELTDNKSLERLRIRTDDVQSELRLSSFRIIAPFGAIDNGLSTGQQFTVQAQVLGARAANVTISLAVPPGFRTNDNTQQLFTALDEQRDVNWTLQAPLASRLDSIVVTVNGYDANNNARALPTVRGAIALSVVEQARLAVSGEISSPLSAAVDGIVTRNQLFTVTARLLNRGAASLASGSRAQLELTLPRDSSIPLAEDYSTTSSLRQEITDFGNGVASWEIKARNIASTQIDNIRVTLLQPFPKDENTDSTATVEDVQDLIGVQTEPKTLVVQMLPLPSSGPVAQGEKSSLLMRLKLTNQGNLNSSNILLRGFTLFVRNRNDAPQNANSVIKALRVVDTHHSTRVLSNLTSIPAADSLKIPFAPADTLLGGVPDSIDVVVDIADNNASGSAFRLTFAKSADVDAIDQESREVVEIVFLDEQGNSVAAAQITSKKRVIDAVDFETSFYNYPNPFSPLRDNADGTRGTQFKYFLPQPSDVEFRIYTLLGELVYERSYKSGDPEGNPTGSFKHLSWDGRNGNGDIVLNGVYIAMLKTSAGTATTKVAVVK